MKKEEGVFTQFISRNYDSNQNDRATKLGLIVVQLKNLTHKE